MPMFSKMTRKEYFWLRATHHNSYIIETKCVVGSLLISYKNVIIANITPNIYGVLT